MGVLQRFERRLGGIVEGAFARVFKGGVEPVELAGALTRECDERRARGAKRTLVPNDFTIHLSEPDFERLAPYRQALSDELATLVREHAAAQRYTFVAPGRRPPGAGRRALGRPLHGQQRCRRRPALYRRAAPPLAQRATQVGGELPPFQPAPPMAVGPERREPADQPDQPRARSSRA